MIDYEKMINRDDMSGFSEYLQIGEEDQLLFCGMDCRTLVKEYGSPLMVFSEKKIRENYRKMQRSFLRYYDKVQICFAYKSNSLISLLKILHSEGAFADVVSEGEFFKSAVAGLSADKVIFNGNNKSDAEMELGIGNGAMFNVDSLSELRRLIQTAERMGKRARVSIRVNPDVSSGTIAEFTTASKKSKFGIDIDSGEAMKAFALARDSAVCQVEGIHIHIGSQIEESRFYKASTEKILDFCGSLKKELGLELRYINFGGGFAIPFDYLEEADPIEEFAKTIGVILKEKLALYGMEEPMVLVEPGGSLVGNTAVTLCTVGAIKEKEEKSLAALDAGADMLLRATQDWYTYRVVCAGKMVRGNMRLYDLVGPLCYDGDIPAHNRFLPELETGDIIAFIDTGAYTCSLFNNYNGRKSPAVLLVKEDGREVEEIRKRDTNLDLLKNEVF